MTRRVILLLCFNLSFVMMLVHEKPITKEVWSGFCTKHSMVLNDCNWCTCDRTHKYICKARVCNEVDAFGHFNDAIRDIKVGMEAHGAWRTTETPCEPGVRYQRDNLLCICDEDGNWPNPVCRNIFQMLHSVKVTQEIRAKTQECTPELLHLFGCNVCFCPSNGRINSKLCTTKNCDSNELKLMANAESKTVADEIYADCTIGTKYKIGCKTCICLKNNRLLCDNSTVSEANTCIGKEVGQKFNVDCNSCFCDEKGLIYCTVKKCLIGSHTKILASRLTLPDVKFKLADKPFSDRDCIPGTTYKNKCNSCYCFINNGMKIFGCTLNKCDSGDNKSCIEGTVYEMDCLICHCEVRNGIKTQLCQVDYRCTGKDVKEKSVDLKSLHGYCEPLHTYKEDCNSCTCNEDGQTVVCTTKNCNEQNPILIEFIPVVQNIGSCPKGYSYRIDCNICFCLSNGNAICSSAPCKENDY